MLCWHIHPNVIFMYNMVACRVNSWELRDVYAFVHVCVCVCVRRCLLPSILVLTKSRGLHPALYFCTLVATVLCRTEQSKKNKKHWQALTTFWTGLGSFYFQFKRFESVLEVTKFLSSAMREEFKLQLKSPQPRSEVLSLTFFKSWSMKYFSWAVRLNGNDKWGSGFFCLFVF